MANLSASSSEAVITGLGFIAPAPFQAAWSAPDTAPPECAPEITGFETPEGAPAFGFEIPEFRLEDHLPHLKTYMDRTSALALAAARLALADAGLLSPAARPAGVELGCAYGTTLGCLEAMGIFWKKVKAGNPKFAPPLPFTHGYANSPSSLLCIEFGLRGSAATFSGEWLSGVEALLFAVDQIATGGAQMLLVGASESLTPAAHAHLAAAGHLSASGRLAPWDAAHDGVVPGEGAAFLVVESAANAAARGRRPYAHVAGVGLGADVPSGGTEAAWERAAVDAFRPNGAPEGPVLIVAATPAPAALDRVERAAWSRLLKAGGGVRAVAPKLLTGELLSVSPVLGTLVAAAVLGGRLQSTRFPLAPLAGGAGPEPAGGAAAAESFAAALVGAADPGGAVGLVALRSV